MFPVFICHFTFLTIYRGKPQKIKKFRTVSFNFLWFSSINLFQFFFNSIYSDHDNANKDYYGRNNLFLILEQPGCTCFN